MPAVCLYFQVHQPFRVKKYGLFQIGSDHDYFNETFESNLNNFKILKKVSQKCYLPANKILLNSLKKYPRFKISFSFSGVFLESLEEFAPETLVSFQELVKTGRVEILEETYYHSLSFLYSKEEFRKQVQLHRKKVKQLFGQSPKVFRNTELIYNNDLAKEIERLGYLGILSEGADHILGWRSPNFVYQPKATKKLKLLLKNYRLSDDVAFRFSSRDWADFPLTAEKFGQWISAASNNGEVVNLFMDYETFGEHQWKETGIFEFLKALPKEIFKNPENSFVTPTEAVTNFKAASDLDIPEFISWADIERDLSAWRSNPLQNEALEKIYALEEEILALEDQQLVEDWRKLQTSDHFYYMCTKWFADGDVHKYFNPYSSPYEAFVCFMNVLNDLKLRIKEKELK
jgi:alpha-amylase